jgi:hypothetical protein
MCEWIMNWEGCRRKQSLHNLKLSPSIWKEGLRKPTKELGHDSHCGPNSKWTPPGCKSKELPLEPASRPYWEQILATIQLKNLSSCLVWSWSWIYTNEKYNLTYVYGCETWILAERRTWIEVENKTLRIICGPEAEDVTEGRKFRTEELHNFAKYYWEYKIIYKKTPWLWSASELYQPSDRRLLGK